MRLIAPVVMFSLASACASPILPSPSPVPHPGPSAPAPTPTTEKPVNPTPEPAPAPTSGQIVLHVVNGKTHAPVWMAEITLDATDLGKTDASGNFTLTVTYGQPYVLTVYHGEYQPLHVALTFSASDTTYAVGLVSLR